MDSNISKLLLFGETKTHRKIIEFDFASKTASTLSSRVRIPIPQIKYDSLELLYEESQDIFNPTSYGVTSLPPFNSMLALYLQEDIVFLCGGKDYDSSYPRA